MKRFEKASFFCVVWYTLSKYVYGWLWDNMKKKIVLCLGMVLIGMTLLGCHEKLSITEESGDEYREIIENTRYENCEIIEDSDPICERPISKGIYTSKTQWDAAVKSTDVDAVTEKKDEYDEEFFSQNVLFYIADTSSGNSQCKYEGFVIEEVDGQQILTIKVSYSTELLLNKLHGYNFFFSLDKGRGERISDVKLELFERK